MKKIILIILIISAISYLYILLIQYHEGGENRKINSIIINDNKISTGTYQYVEKKIESLNILLDLPSNWIINERESNVEDIDSSFIEIQTEKAKIFISGVKYSQSIINKIERLKRRLEKGLLPLPEYDYTGGSLPEEKYMEDLSKYDVYIGEVDGWLLYRDSNDNDHIVVGKSSDMDMVTRDLGLFGHTNSISSIHIQYEFDEDLTMEQREKLINEFDKVIASMKEVSY